MTHNRLSPSEGLVSRADKKDLQLQSHFHHRNSHYCHVTYDYFCQSEHDYHVTLAGNYHRGDMIGRFLSAWMDRSDHGKGCE